MATHAEIITHIRSTLGPVGDRLAMDAATYSEIVAKVVSAYGVPDEASLPAGWEAVAKYLTWDTALVYATGLYNFTADGGSFQRQQQWEQIEKLVAAAKPDHDSALATSGTGAQPSTGGIITIGAFIDVQDPYSYQNED